MFFTRLLLYNFLVIVCLLFHLSSASQCPLPNGLPPSTLTFNTGVSGSGGVGVGGAQDPNWKVATNSINGTYDPAVVMTSYPPSYFSHSLLTHTWISFSETGSHTGNRDFYFKRDFTLPCFNVCGKNYSDDNAFCLDLTIYVDNSVPEIYVNGVPQGTSVGLIPDPNPYNPPGVAGAIKTSVSLCKGWKPGNNTVVIRVASSAIVMGLLVESSFRSPPLSDTVHAAICAGLSFPWRNKSFNKSGLYRDTVHLSPTCDSVKILDLTVWPKADTAITASICKGQSFMGYDTGGLYIDTLVSATGCDSIRRIQLSTLSAPVPQLQDPSSYCVGDSLLLSPGQFQSYLWQDGSTKENYTVKTPGLYAVTVTNACGSIRKQITVTEKACNISFPNAFTPNGDGKNDDFKILSSYLFQEYHLVIYNRWGQKVFESRDPAKGWDGIYKGKLQQSGAFLWQSIYKRAGIISSMKGSVLLIR